MEFFNKSDYSYMLGPDVFVTPYLEKGVYIDVTFPDDGSEWVYLYDKTQVYQPDETISMNNALEEYPVFLRKGSDIAEKLEPRNE